MKEIWLEVPNSEGRYQVSNIGRLKHINWHGLGFEKIANLSKNNRYKSIEINGKSFILHRIIAQIFIPNPENKTEVNHKNFLKHDNRIENLEWVTPKENRDHLHKNHKRGCW